MSDLTRKHQQAKVARTYETPRTVNWERVARAMIHQTKVDILDALEEEDGGRLSPSSYGVMAGIGVGVAAYHFRGLEKAGLIRCVAKEPRRGALESFYVLGES